MAARKDYTRYPYRKWTDGEWHTAHRGTDFTVIATNFRIALTTWARKNGYTLDCRIISEDQVELQFNLGGPRCKSCGLEYERRSSAHKYCDTCVPDGNMRARQLMSYYRMPWPEYQERLAALDNRLCPICQTWEATAVDHDHNCCGLIKDNGSTCGQCNRGILCIGCNIMIEKYESGRIDYLPPRVADYLLG